MSEAGKIYGCQKNKSSKKSLHNNRVKHPTVSKHLINFPLTDTDTRAFPPFTEELSLLLQATLSSKADFLRFDTQSNGNKSLCFPAVVRRAKERTEEQKKIVAKAKQ